MNLKKVFAVALAMILTAGTFTACGEKKTNNIPDDGKPVLNLALRSGIYADVIEECAAQFELEHDVHCNVLELNEEELHSMVAQDAANPEGTFDLCMVDGSWMAEYTNDKILANLSELGYVLDEDIISATTEICYWNDSVYLTPYYGNVTVLLYNKSILQKAGYEITDIKSLEDILYICKKAQKSGNYGFMYRGDSNNNYVVDFLPILLAYGGWVVDENNHPTVNTEEFREAMNFYLELTATGKAEPRDNLVMAVANNAAAMAIGWPGWYTPGRNATADYCALTGRAGENSPVYNANVYGIWTLGIPANSTRKELAKELLEYLMDPEVQKSTVESGGVPCRYSSLKDEEILKQYPQYEEVCNALESGIYRPIMVEWPEFYSILGEEMENIMKGKKNVDEGLSDAQKRLEECKFENR